jgi:hypothetical protein
VDRDGSREPLRAVGVDPFGQGNGGDRLYGWLLIGDQPLRLTASMQF